MHNVGKSCKIIHYYSLLGIIYATPTLVPFQWAFSAGMENGYQSTWDSIVYVLR